MSTIMRWKNRIKDDDLWRLAPFTSDQVAKMLKCSHSTVQERARRGDLAGVKFGESWVFPRAAFEHRLNEMVLEQAALRKKPSEPSGLDMKPMPSGKRLPVPPRKGPR